MRIPTAFLLKTILLLISHFSYSQFISGQIIDSISKNPIDLATISFANSNYIFLSDSKGYFKIDSTYLKQNLIVSNIGYKSKKVKLPVNANNCIIYLSPYTEELNEVIISSSIKKTNYSPDKYLKSKKDNAAYYGFQFNTEHCVFIANPYNKKGKIKSLSLELDQLKGYLENKKYKIDYLAAYNIKFYSYDKQKNKPGKEIYNKNIIVEPENKKYSLKIDVDSLHIPFPESGLCIGVEIINTKYKNPKKTFAYIGPILKFYENRHFSPTTSWTKYESDEKQDYTTSITQDFAGKKYSTLIVDLTVNIEK
jgi:hypothetical protein